MSNFISDQEAMREFADNLWRQDFQFRVQKMLNHALNGYRAEVVENPGGGKLTVRFPFEESTRTFKCSESMRDSVVGDQVLVECLGSLSNPFIRCYADMRDVAFETAENANATADLALTLSSAKSRRIPAGTDYNDIIEPGVYHTYSNADAAKMINAPETGAAHKLIVMQSQMAGRRFQISIVNLNSCRIKLRYFNGTSYGSWVQLATV